MFYLFLPIVVPIVIYAFLPKFIELLTGKVYRRDRMLLVACFLYFISWYIPSPLIHGRDTSFMTHLIGGGIFSGFVWLSIKKSFAWKLSWLMELMSLFALVSSLGVLNELFELTIVELKLVHKLNGADTWWDLLANTLGAILFWAIYRLIVHFGSLKRQQI